MPALVRVRKCLDSKSVYYLCVPYRLAYVSRATENVIIKGLTNLYGFCTYFGVFTGGRRVLAL